MLKIMVKVQITLQVLEFLIKSCNHRGKAKLARRKKDLCMYEDVLLSNVLFTYSDRRSQEVLAVPGKKDGCKYVFIRNGQETKASCGGNEKNSKEDFTLPPTNTFIACRTLSVPYCSNGSSLNPLSCLTLSSFS